MSLQIGIVGLPNVGKSTLFNALLKRQAALAANYPFATIEPNIGVIPVPDPRLEKLAEITAEEIASPSLAMTIGDSGQVLRPIRLAEGKQAQDVARMTNRPPIKPATVEFVDIAGLVKGASEGAGLGNKFLSHIREVSVIAHVVRAFEDLDVVREGSVSPEEDHKTIQTELILADLQTVEKQRESKAVKTDPIKKSAVEKLYKSLNEGKAARDILLTNEKKESVKDLFLLSNKPELIVLNVAEQDYTEEKMQDIINQYTSILVVPAENMIVICAKIEAELAALSEEEQKEYLRDLGLATSGLERLIQKAYEQLGLISFLTAGEKEVRAWTIRKGSSAVEAAGGIHTDFMKKFIKAEVISYDDYVSLGGRKKAREVGKARLEGKDYIVQDGDVIEFKIGS
ncbi:MAG: redox-regulated ATPase YchF [Candidatus Levybacteria bacterium]|nr:redox-regulated ATPase YchF [Candidatus Levybacteria bacterium]